MDEIDILRGALAAEKAAHVVTREQQTRYCTKVCQEEGDRCWSCPLGDDAHKARNETGGTLDKTDKVQVHWECECGAHGQAEIREEFWNARCTTVMCPECKRAIMQTLKPQAFVRV